MSPRVYVRLDPEAYDLLVERAGGPGLAGSYLGRLAYDHLGLPQLLEETPARGAPPLGETAQEAATVARAVELKSEGLSLRAIAERLTLEGRRTKRGGTWSAEAIRKVLQRSKGEA